MNRLWVVVCIAGAARIAHAEPHRDAGVAAYQRGDYETAIRELELAYAAEPDPVLLYAQAQAHRLGGHCEEAVELYHRYIDTKPTEEQLAAANNGIALCEQAKKDPDPPPPPVVPQPEPREQPPWYADKVGVGLLIGGGGAVALGATFLVLSSSSASDAERASTRDDFLDKLDEATFRRRVGVVGLVVGGGLLIGSAIRYLTKSDEPAVQVNVGPTSVAVFGRF